MGIYSYELFRFYGVENIIRIGSAGAMSEKIKVRDIVLGMSAYTDSAYMKIFGFSGDCAPCADYGLLSRAVETARQMSLRAHCGPLYTCDAFYAENSPNNAILQKLGVLAVEMEAAGLYLTAAQAQKKALGIMTVSDLPLSDESLPALERQNTFDDMVHIALAVALKEA
jgi:purine-nucleoside phosphorylase